VTRLVLRLGFLACALAACAPATVPPADLPVETRDFSRAPPLVVKPVSARQAGDHLVLTIAIAGAEMAGVKAFFRDSAGQEYQALRLDGAGPVVAEFDMAFAAEGPGAVRLEGLPADPIPVAWTKPPRVIPTEAKIHRGFDLVFGAIGALILLAGYLYIETATGGDPANPATPP
jgi:hypothetical protein